MKEWYRWVKRINRRSKSGIEWDKGNEQEIIVSISINTFFRGFKQDCPDGHLGKDKILEMYSMILPAGNAKVVYCTA